eukprot:COSAG02_NODE_15063_length_1208_cov_1.573490_1_plen_71_part_10
MIDANIFPQHHIREGGASTDGSGGMQQSAATASVTQLCVTRGGVLTSHVRCNQEYIIQLRALLELEWMSTK